MSVRPAHLAIDARPRREDGPWAAARLRNRPILSYLLELIAEIDDRPVAVHARQEEHERLKTLLVDRPQESYRLVTGPTPENAVVLRVDRFYDPNRLRKALRQGRDPETAVLWSLERPHSLVDAETELERRKSYQPLGRFWALAPATAIARALKSTSVRPNALTILSASCVCAASIVVALGSTSWFARFGTALALAIGLILDTADGRLAREQGTASAFGRWLDSFLDECGDLALHGAIAWNLYQRDRSEMWLVVGLIYIAGKHLLYLADSEWAGIERNSTDTSSSVAPASSIAARFVRFLGHADIRWHLWIVLAAIGRLEVGLAAYAVYYPARTFAGAIRKGVNRA
ncbi:MAG: hypothetical protein NVSMB14_10510 [Isosphaeraceae bacterium]